MHSFIWRRCIGWLDRRGLHSVAAVLEMRAAQRGNTAAGDAAARRALMRGDHAAALTVIEPLIKQQPRNAALWCTRGIAYRMALKFDASLADYQRANQLDPKDVRTLSNLGEWYLARNSFEQALTWLDAALVLNPDYYEARVNHVAALIELRQFERARSEAVSLVRDYPHRPEPFGNLGNVLLSEGKHKEAVEQYKKALEIRPDYAEAHFILAALLGFSGEQELVVDYLERSIEERGESRHRLMLLAVAHKECGNFEKAIHLSRKVIAAYPDEFFAKVNLAGCLSDTGYPKAAMEAYRDMPNVQTRHSEMASNEVFEMNYLPEYSRKEVFERHVDWAAKYEEPIALPPNFLSHNRDRHRKLRLGFVSADFRSHPVGFLLRDVFQSHNKNQFEIHCFSTSVKKDFVTEQIATVADSWSDVVFETPQELAARIRKTQVDILVDLSGHTGGHRLTSFALRPAPVQATWIGYFNTTGMASIDYFITDPYTSPPGSGQLFSERALHLPHTRFCYSPPDYAGEVLPAPVLRNGFVTFGSFNRLPKISSHLIDAWAQILHAIPTSRMLMKAAALADESVRRDFLARFAERGIDANRLEFRAASAHREMLAEYGDIDIALDTSPFNGGMTSMEALWMGVPVVTVAGNTVVSRQTFSVLANIGLTDELAFPDAAAYVEGAIKLAQDTDRLASLRAGMRERMIQSPLRNAPQFTRDLETLLRRMWVAWCNGSQLPSDIDP